MRWIAMLLLLPGCQTFKARVSVTTWVWKAEVEVVAEK